MTIDFIQDIRNNQNREKTKKKIMEEKSKRKFINKYGQKKNELMIKKTFRKYVYESQGRWSKNIAIKEIMIKMKL